MADVLRCLGIVLLAVLITPAAAVAHTDTVETTPENGARLSALPVTAAITFSEEPKQVDIVLAEPGGKIETLTPRLDGTTVTVELPANGPRGDYGLSYRVVSADGHPVSGTTTFTVTAGPVPTKSGEPASARSQASGSSSLAIAGGVALVAVLAGLILWRKRR